MRENEAVADTFASRFATVRSGPGPLVWGLDPSGRLLEAWGLGDSPGGLDRFADIVLDAAAGTVGLVKPQSAFFERHGWRGIRTLSRLIADARSAGLLVILDVKRGDVGAPTTPTREAFLGPGAPLAADAVTVHPYLGLAAMDAFVSRAHQAGSCLLVVTRSSNPEGRAGPVRPRRRRPPGRRRAAPRDRAAEPQAGARGDRPGRRRRSAPTHMEPELDLAGAQALFLAPGVGAQGATPAGRGPGLRGLPGPGHAQRVEVAAARRSRCQRAAGRRRRAGRRVPRAPARQREWRSRAGQLNDARPVFHRPVRWRRVSKGQLRGSCGRPA